MNTTDLQFAFETACEDALAAHGGQPMNSQTMENVAEDVAARLATKLPLGTMFVVGTPRVRADRTIDFEGTLDTGAQNTTFRCTTVDGVALQNAKSPFTLPALQAKFEDACEEALKQQGGTFVLERFVEAKMRSQIPAGVTFAVAVQQADALTRFNGLLDTGLVKSTFTCGAIDGEVTRTSAKTEPPQATSVQKEPKLKSKLETYYKCLHMQCPERMPVPVQQRCYTCNQPYSEVQVLLMNPTPPTFAETKTDTKYEMSIRTGGIIKYAPGSIAYLDSI